MLKVTRPSSPMIVSLRRRRSCRHARAADCFVTRAFTSEASLGRGARSWSRRPVELGLHPACADVGPGSAVAFEPGEVAVAMVFELLVAAGGLEDSAFDLVLA